MKYANEITIILTMLAMGIVIRLLHQWFMNQKIDINDREW